MGYYKHIYFDIILHENKLGYILTQKQDNLTLKINCGLGVH
jgi:hypothetical protein